MQQPYTTPTHDAKAFNCPFCSAYAAQRWLALNPVLGQTANMTFYSKSAGWSMSSCSHCGAVAMWRGNIMLYPEASQAPTAHSDMPESMRMDYEEAQSVLTRSPRSAAALLRLCLQKLCKELGEPGDNINTDIASLVRKGLPVEVQQALDIVRVVGNEQVHPGELDLRDNPEIAVELFNLVNFIIEDRISRPKSISAIYQRLPASKVQGIKERDSKSN